MCSFWDVFYIDATTRETISAGLIALAKAANAGSTPEEALSWLVSQEERWLLVFNNADDPTLKLQEFFPACTHGDILITTRNQQLRAHTHGPGSYCRVSGMLADDALKLILRASGAGEEENAVSIATQLVKVGVPFHDLRDFKFIFCRRTLASSPSRSCNPVHTYAQPSVD